MQPRTIAPILCLALAIAATAAVPGCGGPADRVWVTGKVVKGGARYTPPDDQVLGLTFIPLEHKTADGKTVQGGDHYAAEVIRSDSTFEVPGPDRLGIPRGKYRVAVTQKLSREAYAAARTKSSGGRGKPPLQRDADTLAGRFGPTTSPIVVEIARPEDLDIDLDKAPEAGASAPAAAGARAQKRR